MKEYQKFVFIGIVTISLGIVIYIMLSESYRSIGTVRIALGGLFFMIGMSKKKVNDDS